LELCCRAPDGPDKRICGPDYGIPTDSDTETVTRPCTYPARAGAITIRTLDDAGNLLSETNSGGLLSGVWLTNCYDQYLRRTNCVVLNGSTVLSSNVYGYDLASRMSSAGDGINWGWDTIVTLRRLCQLCERG
jgi:hypothetical protein